MRTALPRSWGRRRSMPERKRSGSMFKAPRNREPVIVGYVRTPFGRADKKNGHLRSWRSDDLGIHVVKELVRRTGVAPAMIDEVILGAVELIGEQAHPGRNVAFLAGLPHEVTG